MFLKKTAAILMGLTLLSTLNLVYLFSSIVPSCKAEENFFNQGGITSRNITLAVKDTTILYSEEITWNKERFQSILQDKDDFMKVMMSTFTNEVANWNLKVAGVKIDFNEGKRSTTLNCEIQGCISKNGNKYTADFFWLLKPSQLDFIEDNFKEARNSLSWKGTINNVSTTITILLPLKEKPYKAWQEPNGHCHAHVWWTETVTLQPQKTSVTPSPLPTQTPPPNLNYLLYFIAAVVAIVTVTVLAIYLLKKGGFNP